MGIIFSMIGDWITGEEPPPPVVLVPPLFDFPPLAARSRMAESSYDFLFSKVSRACLFGDYFQESGKMMARISLRPPDDPRVDFTATLRGPFGRSTDMPVKADGVFRWQRHPQDPHNFVDLKVSNSDNALQLRSCAFYRDYGVGVFAVLPVLIKKRITLEDYGIMGVRYGSKHLSVGTTFTPIPSTEFPTSMWMVGRMGQITSGVQYKPVGKEQVESIRDLRNWSFAIDYGTWKKGPLNPSFNFSMEYCNNKELIASFYQHLVVQRRVKNPFEGDSVVGITNFIDLGFEIHSRINGEELHVTQGESNIQVAASWQANKNILLKAKLGSASSAAALTFKSWWQPSVAFSFACEFYEVIPIILAEIAINFKY
ncbi:hypothetical protein KI387_033647 [Taxus chinensis]|uniref:Uncharacterized protein n=1 Tax=Taxus chinensis TaxID=29808 RepID=A0AA38BSK2_TAXCH|nr:hypothetical protein KI387_033647 [Taxus chinensis]